MIEAAYEHPGQVLMVGFNRRFAPLVLKMRNFYANRAEPMHVHYRVNAGYIPSNHWTQDPVIGGGRIIGEGCHFIDLALSLVKQPIIAVSANALPNAGKYKNDNVSMVITFSDGSIATIDYLANGDKSFQKESVEVFCAGRIAILDDFRSLLLVHDGKRESHKLNWGQDKGHTAEIDAFTHAVKTGKAAIEIPELRAVTLASFAAVESLSNNGVRVAIDQS